MATLKRKSDNFIVKSFFALKILLFLACFNASAVYFIRFVGDLAIYLAIILTAFTILYRSKYVIISKYQIVLTAYAGVCLFGGLFTGISLSMISQILLIAWISVYSDCLGSKKILNGVAQILAVLLPFCVVDLLLFHFAGTAPLFGNPNRVGIMGFLCFTVGVLWKVKYRKSLAVTGFILILLSNARTPLLVLALGFIIYLMLKNRTGFGATVLFLFVAICCTLLVAFYINAQNYKFMVGINQLIFDLTGKSLFSGRQQIWANIFGNFNINKLILGYGLNFNVADLNGLNLSAHNQFIQLIVQQGLVGLFLWAAVLLSLYTAAFKNGRKKLCVFAVMVIIYNMFEVFLLQNHFALGLLVWLILFANDGKSKVKSKARAVFRSPALNAAK